MNDYVIDYISRSVSIGNQIKSVQAMSKKEAIKIIKERVPDAQICNIWAEEDENGWPKNLGDHLN
jgi:hypothetical protein